MTDPFKKDHRGQHTRKVKRILQSIDYSLSRRGVLPAELKIQESTAKDLLDPDFSGCPKYRDIPITVVPNG